MYQVGAGVEPPHRVDRPIYPKEAVAAGIQGSVQAEIVIDETGVVADARVVRSVPMLDDEALKAVRRWSPPPSCARRSWTDAARPKLTFWLP